MADDARKRRSGTELNKDNYEAVEEASSEPVGSWEKADDVRGARAALPTRLRICVRAHPVPLLICTLYPASRCTGRPRRAQDPPREAASGRRCRLRRQLGRWRCGVCKPLCQRAARSRHGRGTRAEASRLHIWHHAGGTNPGGANFRALARLDMCVMMSVVPVSFGTLAAVAQCAHRGTATSFRCHGPLGV